MNRRLYENHLAQAERDLILAAERIASQMQIVCRLDWIGLDSREARKLLVRFEEMQSIARADRDRLKNELMSGTGTDE